VNSPTKKHRMASDTTLLSFTTPHQ
jgi:hypothetical protein